MNDTERIAIIRRILGVETLAEPGEEPRVERRKGERRISEDGVRRCSECGEPKWHRAHGSDRRKAGA